MKRIVFPLVVGTLLAQGAPAAIQSLPFVDHFNYPQGNLPAVAPSGVWDVSGQSGAEITVQTNAALTGPSSFAASSGNGVRWLPGGTARRNMVQFGPITNMVGNAVYASFLINVQTAPSSDRQVVYINNANTQPSSAQPLGVYIGNGTIGIGKSAAPAFSTTISSGTHLVVVRYTFTGTTTDQADMWLDPTNTSYGASVAPPPLGGASGGSNPTQLTYFGIYSASGAGPSFFIDEVRISTNWADVVPGTPPPPPPSSPQITQVSMIDQSFVIQGVGGTSNGVFDVLASTDFDVPVAEWGSIGSYNFDGSGNFNVTNPVPEGTESEFFALYVADTSTNTPPFIISEPQNQQVLEGQGAQFSVTAGGSLPLRYQWYFNTNTVLIAGTNATLTISNVQSNNIGGYSVIVSNTAGSITSVVASLTLGEPVTNGNWYVSPTGNDNNPGTFNQPFWNLQKALDRAEPGHTIYMRGGTYLYASTLRITNSGTALLPVKLWAYPGEKPLLDFVNQPFGDSNRGMLITTNGNHWHIKGLEIARAGDNGIKIEGSYHRIEECVFHHNRDSGLQIGFGHPAVNNLNLAAFIEVINCDSYSNFDPPSGGDADGFAAKLHCGQGIVFTGCRAWENSDDGWDLFETDASVVISNCWTWKSAPTGQGNGNGFKLGGNGTGGESKGTHYAYNCVSFSHKVNCYTQNSHKDGLVVINCVGFSPGNSGYNFFMEGSMNSGKQNVFKNNASIPRSGTLTGGFIADNNPIEQNNSWNLPAVTVNSADFVTIAEAAAKAPRGPDGSLPPDFARLVAGSDLIDKGVDVNIPYCGSAPDLGAYEYCP